MFSVLGAFLCISHASAVTIVREAHTNYISVSEDRLGPITLAAPFEFEVVFDGSMDDKADALAEAAGSRQASRSHKGTERVKRLNTSCPVLAESLVVLSSMRFPRLGSCALVGSGSTLLGQGKGPE